MLAVELKTMKGEVSPAQQKCLDAFAGVETVETMVVRPDTASDLIRRLRQPI